VGTSTIQLILFAEQLAGLAAQTIASLKGVLGASGPDQEALANAALDDADAKYRAVIAAAKSASTPPMV